MAAEEARQVHSSSELSVGDEIEAWHNGKLFHRGRVSQTVASMDLFWIVDSRTGTRRLIDAEALVILRAAAPEKAATAGTSAGAAPAGAAAQARTGSVVPVYTASHIPLFQAPSLAL